MGIEITRVSSKGQVVIPSTIRNSMNIKPSDEFFVVGEGDTIVFRKISDNILSRTFSEITAPLARIAREAGIVTEKDVENLIHKHRRVHK